MTNSQLPDVVSRYFQLMEGEVKEQVADLFTPDAQVIDDGTTYRGRAEIIAWLSGQASEWVTTSSQLSADCTDQVTVVVIRVEGNFPGGRVDLRTTFTLDSAEGISTLSISA
jgi:limonene-1,2-epoxide hydrolase